VMVGVRVMVRVEVEVRVGPGLGLFGVVPPQEIWRRAPSNRNDKTMATGFMDTSKSRMLGKPSPTPAP
jgi:hypothetical protein